MRILIVMAGFFPGKKYGGPPVSIDNFCSLMNEHECYIVTHDHDLTESERYKGIETGWNDRGNCKVLYLSDPLYRKTSFEEVIMYLQPDLLYLQGLFQSCVFPCLQLAKKHDIAVLLAPRGELCAGAFNMKRWKKVLYVALIRRMGLIKKIHWQSTSGEETEAIKHMMKVDDSFIHRLDNIPSIPKKEYPRREKVAGEGRFVFLSRIHPKKNLLFAISLFKEIKGAVSFDIYGPIEEEKYWKQCQDEIIKLPENVKVEYKGLVDHDQVHEVFSRYDAFVFPTHSENYGHVIAEALMVGCPVIISDQTPWNAVNQYSAGKAISLSNCDLFSTALQDVVDSDDKKSKEISENAKRVCAEKMKTVELRDKYLQCFSKELIKSVCYEKSENNHKIKTIKNS